MHIETNHHQLLRHILYYKPQTTIFNFSFKSKLINKFRNLFFFYKFCIPCLILKNFLQRLNNFSNRNKKHLIKTHSSLFYDTILWFYCLKFWDEVYLLFHVLFRYMATWVDICLPVDGWNFHNLIWFSDCYLHLDPTNLYLLGFVFHWVYDRWIYK